MEGPFVSRRAYMYGNTFFEYPVPYYNSTLCHCPKRRPPIREFPEMVPFEDPDSYIADESGAESIGIVRPGSKYMILDIETSIIKTLKVTIYGATEEDDKTILMQVGKRYAITYMTQSGLRTADGYLRYISSSIPDECTRYISATNPTEVALSFIGLDCSTKGISDKRKIYIASIRGIEALADDEDYIPPVDKDNATYTLYEVLAALNKATEALKEMNENNVCQQVLSGIDRIETDLLDLIERVTPDEHGNNTEPTNP
jgi:hypothetical protein